MNENIKRLAKQTLSLPQEPGVYFMRDKQNNIIYIGKAKSLKNRVTSYFRSVEKHHPKVYRMVMNVDNFDIIVTNSEFEALVLECSLIKQYKPKYNILLKDDKGYRYIKISHEDYPRITAEKQKPPGDKGTYIGPYISGFIVNKTVEELHRAFMLPTCKRRFPQDFKKQRPCLNFHLKQCIGVCNGKISKTAYNQIISDAVEYMSGDSKKTVEELSQQMNVASEILDFERAAILRDRISAIKRVNERQNVVFTKEQNLDVVALAQNNEDLCAVILKFRAGRLVDKVDFMLGEAASLSEARGEFILTYYNGQESIPKNIAIDGPCEDIELIEQFLSKKTECKISITIPQRGEKLRLVRMANTNAAELLAQKNERTSKEISALDELSRLLGLDKTPYYIESYDISNWGEQTAMAGMIVFENARPLKKAYRKFGIKTVSGADDYGAMKEVIERRLLRYESEKHTNEGFGRLPDLILLDGGKGHVSAVKSVLEKLGFNIPVFGMVKDDKHRTRAIAKDGGEISIISTKSAFALVTKIQDEVHRFSITGMQKKHTKTSFALKLTTIPGIGEARAQALFKHFKTIKAMRSATVEEILKVPGMTAKTAEALHGFLN